MAPSAVYITSTPSQVAIQTQTATKLAVAVAVPATGPALAIGSPATAQDGKYQSLITSLEHSREVERHMVDRLLDGGMSINTIRGARKVSVSSSYHPPACQIRLHTCYPLSS